MIKTNIKMRVTPEQSRKVQEICFSNGIYWAGENKDKEEYKQLQYDYESLRLQSNKKIKDVQNDFKNILDDLNKTIDLLEDRIKEKDTIISYLESKLK